MNESINKSNYEAYFLDYLEGRLSASEAEDLFAFLLTQPSLADELEEMRAGFDIVSNISDLELQSETLDEQDKFNLRKTADRSGLSNSDLLLVKELEGHLSNHEALELRALLEAKPELTRVQAAYRHTRLRPELHIVFEGKEELVFNEKSKLNSPAMLMAAELEGQLTPEERSLLDALCTNNEQLKRERAAMLLAKLTPTAEVFEHKDSLRRKAAVVIPLRRYFAYTAAAAAVAVLIYTVWPQQSTNARMAASWENDKVELKQVSPSSPTENSSTQENAQEIPVVAPFKQRVNAQRTEVANNIPTVPKPEANPSNLSQPEKPNAPQEAPLANQGNNEQPESSSPLQHQDALAQDEHPVTYVADQQKYFTLREIVENKVKSWVWGGKNYPEKSFGAALLNREIAKHNAKVSKKNKRKSKGLEFENVKTKNEQSRRIKIGKFEYNKHVKK
jgi:hypothetical protein